MWRMVDAFETCNDLSKQNSPLSPELFPDRMDLTESNSVCGHRVARPFVKGRERKEGRKGGREVTYVVEGWVLMSESRDSSLSPLAIYNSLQTIPYLATL